MAGELQVDYKTGVTVGVEIRNAVGQIWNTSTAAFQTYSAAQIANYSIVLAEQGASGYYIGDMPAGITTAMVVYARGFERAGGSHAETDKFLGPAEIDWTGSLVAGSSNTVLAATGLDAITVADPTTVATTFPTMMIQLWRRFFKKATKSTTQIKTFRDDAFTVVTTQAITDDGSGNETMGAAT